VWCELVLNGIGGRTIEEAQRRVSYAEFLTWVEYRKKRGSLHSGLRMDRGFALLAKFYADAHTKEGVHNSIWDFTPYEDEPPISLDDAMKAWR
jgi:hypothetical protein